MDEKGLYFITEEKELSDEELNENLDAVEKNLLYLVEVMQQGEDSRNKSILGIFTSLLEAGKLAKLVDPQLRRIIYSIYYLLLDAELTGEGEYIYDADQYLIDLIEERTKMGNIPSKEKEEGLNLFDEVTGKRLSIEDLE